MTPTDSVALPAYSIINRTRFLIGPTVRFEQLSTLGICPKRPVRTPASGSVVFMSNAIEILSENRRQRRRDINWITDASSFRVVHTHCESAAIQLTCFPAVLTQCRLSNILRANLTCKFELLRSADSRIWFDLDRAITMCFRPRASFQQYSRREN